MAFLGFGCANHGWGNLFSPDRTIVSYVDDGWQLHTRGCTHSRWKPVERQFWRLYRPIPRGSSSLRWPSGPAICKGSFGDRRRIARQHREQRWSSRRQSNPSLDESRERSSLEDRPQLRCRGRCAFFYSSMGTVSMILRISRHFSERSMILARTWWLAIGWTILNQCRLFADGLTSSCPGRSGKYVKFRSRTANADSG